MNKKILTLTLLVVMSFVSIFSFSTLVKATNDIELSGTVVTQSGSLNVRKSPSTSSAVIATLKKGSTVIKPIFLVMAFGVAIKLIYQSL